MGVTVNNATLSLVSSATIVLSALLLEVHRTVHYASVRLGTEAAGLARVLHWFQQKKYYQNVSALQEKAVKVVQR